MQKFLKSAFLISIGTLLSRVSGFVRDILIAKYLGSGFYSDIFFMAFRIPNFFRKIFAEGAFNSAFTPIFASGIDIHGKDKMMIFARNIYSILLYFLLVFTLLIEIFMPYLMYLLAPGYLEEKEKFDLVIILTRITFPYIIFISLVSLMSGILNTFNKFFAVSLTPILLNASIIFCIFLFNALAPLKLTIFLSYSIVVAGALQLIWILIFTFKEKIFLYPTFPKFTKNTKEFFKKFSHAFLSSGIVQVNSIIDSVIATLIPAGISILYYGDRIVQFPLSLIGTAIGISILPILSKTLSKRGSKVESQEIQEESIFLSCFLGIPSAFALFAVSNLIITVLFQRGAFTNENTIEVSAILQIYAIALPFFILSKIFQTIFYAKKDTKTPMKNSLYCFIINASVSLSLVFIIGVRGIAIATTLSAIFSCCSLFYILIKQQIFSNSLNFIIRILKILYASILMGIAIYCVSKYLTKINISNLLNLVISFGIGGSLFFAISYFMNILNLKMIKKIF